MDKQAVVALLKTCVAKIVFVKADNSVREMLGTLVDQFIMVESAGSSKPNDDVVVVWDVEKEAWRSFRLDRLISIEKADISLE